MISFVVNQRPIRTDEHPGMVLLEFLRDVACLSGTKEACREGECGACTVLVGRKMPDGRVQYKACASCLLPIGDVEGCHVVTVEGLGGANLTLVQQLIVDNSASQCGFCTPGIVLSLTGFCLSSPTLSYADAVDALDGNICRCTGYVAIRNAAHALCEHLAHMDQAPACRVGNLVEIGVLPAWFLGIPALLQQVQPDAATAMPHGVLVGGGTDLFVQRPEQLLESDLCFLSQRSDLDYIRVEGETLHIGGAVTIEDFRTHPLAQAHFPTLCQDLKLHSSTILRNKATLSGNVVNASPIGDATIILLALDAMLTISNKDGALRQVPLDKFFLGYKRVDLACGEFITDIGIPLLGKADWYHFEKVSNRVHLDIAAVNTAVRLTLAQDQSVAQVRLSAGGVGPTPFLVTGLERFHGRRVDAALADEVAQVAQNTAAPIDDIRGSAKYKKLLIYQLIKGHFMSYMEVTR